MGDKKKNTVFRVFQAAQCGSAKYVLGVLCSAVSILCTAVPFYTVYRIVRIFLEASLHQTSVDSSQAWFWVGMTLASIAAGILLSIAGSVICHACAFRALYDLRMRILGHMGKLNLGFFTGGQSGAVQKTMSDNIEKMEGIIAHDVSNLVGAALLLISLAVLLFSINVLLTLTIFAALAAAFIIQFSAFGGKRGQKIWTELNQSATELDAAFSEYVAGMEEEKIFGRPEAAARRLTGLIEKNRSHLMAYLKRVTPIYGAYKTITLSVLAFILIAGCVLLYLNPGDHQLMMDLLLFLIVGPAVISPLMELVEFGAELRNLSVRMDQIDDVLKMEPTGEGQIDAVPACPALSFRDVSFSYQKAADPLRRMALDHVSMEIPAGSFVALVGPSGGGKSTAGQLLARFWDVESGSIAIGGTDIRDYTARTLMDTVAFVFQDTYIFAESVYDNIAMHRDVSREAVEQAAKAARCHEFILVIRSEIGCLCLFLACLLIHMLAGNGGKILPYGLYYLIFYGIGWLGVHLMDSGVAFSVSSMLSSIGIVSRKVLVPLSFVICLAGEPTGSLMAALQKLHLPKAAGIGTAVVLRFFPTIAGEYRAIRSSQRFRGIGVGVLHTLTHLPTTVEYILIPLILRTTKVAEELSASMTVRGVRFSGETVSYRSIRFCWKDAALLALLLAVACTVLLLERGGVL